MSRSFYVDSLILKPALTPQTPTSGSPRFPPVDGRLDGRMDGRVDGRVDGRGLGLPPGLNLFPGAGGGGLFPRSAAEALRHFPPLGLDR